MAMQFQPNSQNTTPQTSTVYDPQNGETPVSTDFQNAQWGQGQWQGTGGGDVAQEYYAGKEFYKLFGRNPTASELAQFSGAYAGDPNIANTAQGNQAVAQYYQGQSNTPANIYANQQKQWAQGASQHYDSISQIINSMLGRQATQDELQHYGTLISSGQADPYQIQQFIQSTPEYQNAQDTQFRSGLDQDLQKSDTDFFNTQKGNIAQQYAQMGRATSPALDVALTQLASQLNSQRGQYMAQLSAGQYGGNKQAALQGYQNTQGQVQNQINQNTQGIYGARQSMNDRLNNITDYNTQKNDYMSSLNNQNKPGWMDYLNMGLKTGNSAGQMYTAFK